MMKTGELWWSRMINSVRFMDDVKDVLMDGRSVVMNFPGEIPWGDTMTFTLEQQLAFMTDTRLFEVHDVSDIKTNPGKYLFERFCSESERKKYWPGKHKSYEQFLALNSNTVLNRRIVCITGLTGKNADMWIRSVTEYLINRDSEERGVFILVSNGIKAAESGVIGCINYSDYITDYDCQMLCLTVLSSCECSSVLRYYISEIASAVSGNNPQTAGLLAECGKEFAENPYETAHRIFSKNGIPESNLAERIDSAVWEAQIRLVFPRIEDYRRNMVIRYKKELAKYMPVTSSSGEHIDSVSELEIGQLYFICSFHNVLGNNEYNRLRIMREVRNKLAHREILDYSTMCSIVSE